jgi:hypothetical protein
VLFTAGQALDQGRGGVGLAPGSLTNRRAGVRDVPSGGRGGDPYDLDQHGGGNGFGGQVHERSLPVRFAGG